MITGSQMAVVDENAEALGVPRKQLMESSGNAVARVVREVADPGATVTVVAGRGNNGGDASVAARFLDDYNLDILLLGRAETITTDIAQENWEALQAAEYDAREVRDSRSLSLGDPDVVVDAILGTGISGDLRGARCDRRSGDERQRRDRRLGRRPSGFDADTGTLP